MNDLFVALCDWCIDAMVYFSGVSGISYSAINIILFVMLGPLSTVIAARLGFFYISASGGLLSHWA